MDDASQPERRMALWRTVMSYHIVDVPLDTNGASH